MGALRGRPLRPDHPQANGTIGAFPRLLGQGKRPSGLSAQLSMMPACRTTTRSQVAHPGRLRMATLRTRAYRGYPDGSIGCYCLAASGVRPRPAPGPCGLGASPGPGDGGAWRGAALFDASPGCCGSSCGRRCRDRVDTGATLHHRCRHPLRASGGARAFERFRCERPATPRRSSTQSRRCPRRSPRPCPLQRRCPCRQVCP